jgi:hypothetical protein
MIMEWKRDGEGIADTEIWHRQLLCTFHQLEPILALMDIGDNGGTPPPPAVQRESASQAGCRFTHKTFRIVTFNHCCQNFVVRCRPDSCVGGWIRKLQMVSNTRVGEADMGRIDKERRAANRACVTERMHRTGEL